MFAPNKNMFSCEVSTLRYYYLLLLFAQMKVALVWCVPMKEMWEKALPCKFSLKDKGKTDDHIPCCVLEGVRMSAVHF